MLLCLCLARDAIGEHDELARTAARTNWQLRVVLVAATEARSGVLNRASIAPAPIMRLEMACLCSSCRLPQ
jgi:hypothetical protein